MKFSSLCKNVLVPLCLPYSCFIGCSVIGAAVGLTVIILFVDAERQSESDCNSTASSCGNSRCVSPQR